MCSSDLVEEDLYENESDTRESDISLHKMDDAVIQISGTKPGLHQIFT